jgi:hypothetical protein
MYNRRVIWHQLISYPARFCDQRDIWLIRWKRLHFTFYDVSFVISIRILDISTLKQLIGFTLYVWALEVSSYCWTHLIVVVISICLFLHDFKNKVMNLNISWYLWKCSLQNYSFLNEWKLLILRLDKIYTWELLLIQLLFSRGLTRYQFIISIK